MGVTMDARYEGELHCTLTHGPSGTRIHTDAPTDNRGKGESFSPTDLVGAALGSCALTTMAMRAADHGWSIDGADAHVTKEMGSEPRRHVARLLEQFTMPSALDGEARAFLENTARTCPVASSLGNWTAVEMTFRYA